jgi:hypothetical protein
MAQSQQVTTIYLHIYMFLYINEATGLYIMYIRKKMLRIFVHKILVYNNTAVYLLIMQN